MEAFRFIHAADVHIDSPLVGLPMHDGATALRLRSASRDAFVNLVGRALSEHVDFLVIAGDLYDGDWRDFRTGLFFVNQMGRLAQAGIPVFLLYGNHDAASQITQSLHLPVNVHVFPPSTAKTFTIDTLGVALHGQSFRAREVTDDLVPNYPEPVPGYFNIGVLHTALTGEPGHANYAPCSVEELTAKGYDYWALGHVHAGRVVSEHPYIVFPGNLQGRHIRETGPKGARLVTVRDGRVVGFDPLHCDVVRWSRVAVPVGDCERLPEVYDRIQAVLEATVAREADKRLLACRIELTGVTPLHSELQASRAQLNAEAKAAAVGLGADVAWIECLVIATQAPLGTTPASSSPVKRDVLQYMFAEADRDAGLVEKLRQDIGELCRRLPKEVRDTVEAGALRSAIDDDYAQVITEVQPYLDARLAKPEG